MGLHTDRVCSVPFFSSLSGGLPRMHLALALRWESIVVVARWKYGLKGRLRATVHTSPVLYISSHMF